MCIPELNKVQVYEFNYDYIRNKMALNQGYYLQILIHLCMKLKPEMFMMILVKVRNV